MIKSKNSKYRIALCLSGQPRGIPTSCKEIINNIINVNDNVDVFLHAWYDPLDVGNPYGSAQPLQDNRVGTVQNDTDKILLETFKPKRSIIEPQRAFPFTEKFKSAPTARQEVIASIFYTMWKANELKKEYESENDFKYDCVIRTRYDLHYHSPIMIKDYSNILKEKIVVPERYQRDQDNIPWNKLKPMVDIFAFSSSENMDTFSSVYPNLEELNKAINPPYGEVYLGYHTRLKNNIDLHQAPFMMDILHRVMNLN